MYRYLSRSRMCKVLSTRNKYGVIQTRVRTTRYGLNSDMTVSDYGIKVKINLRLMTSKNSSNY